MLIILIHLGNIRVKAQIRILVYVGHMLPIYWGYQPIFLSHSRFVQQSTLRFYYKTYLFLRSCLIFKKLLTLNFMAKSYFLSLVFILALKKAKKLF